MVWCVFPWFRTDCVGWHGCNSFYCRWFGRYPQSTQDDAILTSYPFLQSICSNFIDLSCIQHVWASLPNPDRIMCAIVKISTALKTEVIDLLFVNISTCFGCVFVIYIYMYTFSWTNNKHNSWQRFQQRLCGKLTNFRMAVAVRQSVWSFTYSFFNVQCPSLIKSSFPHAKLLQCFYVLINVWYICAEWVGRLTGITCPVWSLGVLLLG